MAVCCYCGYSYWSDPPKLFFSLPVQQSLRLVYWWLSKGFARVKPQLQGRSHKQLKYLRDSTRWLLLIEMNWWNCLDKFPPKRIWCELRPSIIAFIWYQLIFKIWVVGCKLWFMMFLKKNWIFIGWLNSYEIINKKWKIAAKSTESLLSWLSWPSFLPAPAWPWRYHRLSGWAWRSVPWRWQRHKHNPR